MKKELNILGMITFCLVIFGYFFYRDYQIKEPKRIKEMKLNVSFYGVIDSVYRDFSNHGVTVLILKDNKKMNFNMYEYNRFKKHDSLVKHKGEDKIYIYRNGRVKIYKY